MNLNVQHEVCAEDAEPAIQHASGAGRDAKEVTGRDIKRVVKGARRVNGKSRFFVLALDAVVVFRVVNVGAGGHAALARSLPVFSWVGAYR